MRPLSELDHYDLLEVARDASPEEIERAYHVARSAYAEGSLATYSLYGERDTETLRHRIELAWRTLANDEARRRYDATLASGVAPEEPAQPEADPLLDSVAKRLVALERKTTVLPAGHARTAPPPDLRPVVETDPEAERGECDGARLRRARMKRGLEIEQLAAITKINTRYLLSIETDDFEQLPAPVYIHGFVKAFARCVGLEPNAAATSYMARFEMAPPRKRGRILGRQPQA